MAHESYIQSSAVPSVNDRYNAGLVGGDLLKRRHGHVEVVQRHITPSAVVVRQGRVRRAEVSDCDLNRRSVGMAIFLRPGTLHFIASSASQSSVEQSRADGHRVGAVAGAVEVAIATRTPYRRYHTQKPCLKVTPKITEMGTCLPPSL